MQSKLMTDRSGLSPGPERLSNFSSTVLQRRFSLWSIFP
jgi:hypothetical protein